MKIAMILGAMLSASSAIAAVTTYGDKDLLGFGYPGGADPTDGATLDGLSRGS